ncbi:hypothetical protein JJB07_18300 [Tumebacillus sp. ITR2]|uniref:Uncharacterized protein n=1 Tax=Tumebacillus amylolyticus TaxID=2801339 RepID=A0ABS1JE78_9BACL|nr:hypothetical protein [Tumebacillus amylolyticus]MBL0388559.1 hypothetical protein [Tumebacillus amylolyticus]
MERVAAIYLKTEGGTEHRIAEIPLCQVPQVGDKIKIEETWHTVNGVEGLERTAECKVHVE